MFRMAVRVSLFVLIISGTHPASAAFTGRDLFVPIAGRIEGVGESQFYTTLWVTNPSLTSPAAFTIEFLVGGQANPTPPSFADTIQPGETRLYENFTETLFAMPGVLGAARVRSESDLLVASRIYNLFEGETIDDSQGLFFGAVPSDFALRPGESTTVQGVTENSDFRFNFFMVETAGAGVSLSADLLDDSGQLLGGKDYTLAGYEQRLVSVTDILSGQPIDNARLVVTVRSNEGRVLVAGSQTANQSQDATGFEMAFPDRLLQGDGQGISEVVAGAGLTGGGSSGTVTIAIADGGVLSSMIAAGQVVRSLNGLFDDVTLAAGSNVSINKSGNTLTISAQGGSSEGVSSLNGLTGSVSLIAGTNISIIPDGNNLRIVASGLSLPYFATGSNSISLFNITNRTGIALSGVTEAAADRFGVGGYHNSTGNAGGLGNDLVGVGGIAEAAIAAGVGGYHDPTGNSGSLADADAGVHGVAGGPTELAGYFEGDVDVVGTLSKSASTFRIDHPLDPANKYLVHSFVESPDMKNVYDGVVVLGESGEATIELPEWFEALNRDFRYQLTCIGGYAPVFIAAEIEENRFRIGGGHPGLKVSWQVTGIRDDPYAREHPIQVEEDKGPSEAGHYLHPELYGHGPEEGMSTNARDRAERLRRSLERR